MGPQPNYGYYGEQKHGFNWKLVLVIGGGLLLIVLLILTIVALGGQNNIGTQSQHLGARLTNVSTLTASAAKQLQNGDLQKVNAEAAIITTGVQADLSAILPKKADKAIATAESDSTATADLANAALAGTYDREYKQVMAQKLDSITALLTEMYAKTNSRKTRDTLTTDYKNFQAVSDSLQKINP